VSLRRTSFVVLVMLIIHNSDIEGAGDLTIQVMANPRIGQIELVGELMLPVQISPEFHHTKSKTCELTRLIHLRCVDESYLLRLHGPASCS
jgi:hypothetical protein